MTSYLSPAVSVEITSADMGGLLAKLNGTGIVLHGISWRSPLTVTVEMKRSNLNVLDKIAANYGATVKVKSKKGLYWRIRNAFNRPVLLFVLCLVLLLVLWLPTRVLFISVEGNSQIPDQLIIEQANRCGITFGASRRAVRSEKMKNSLLSAIPSLQWAGINTSGCTAIISVKERSDSQIYHVSDTASSIVAGRDGVIESCTALKGNLLCKIGQAVKKGDVLISGYTDYGLCVKTTRADGEIFAQTKHEITVITPLDYQQKAEPMSVKKYYCLSIGKKRINFNKCSGISDTLCDKIYFDYYMTLPGGYRLPIALHVTVVQTYENLSVAASAENAQTAAEQAARQYLLSQMISGKFLQEHATFWQQGKTGVLSGHYICSEMIGRVQHEEIYNDYGKDN